MSDTCSYLPLPEVPPLSPTYPEDTDKGIELGFQRGPLLWQGKTMISAGREQPMSRAMTLGSSSSPHPQAQA